MCFLSQADEYRYADITADLKSGVFRGRDKYPCTVTEAYELLIRTSRERVYVQRRTARTNPRTRFGRNNFSFTQRGGLNNNQSQVGTPVAGRDRVMHEHITCFSCRSKRHYSDQCPNNSTSSSTQGTGLAQVSF